MQYYMTVRPRLDKGETLSSYTAKDLVDRFLEDQEKRICEGGRQSGGITAERFVTIRTGLKHYLKFVGEKTKLDKIQQDKFKDYFTFRRSHSPDVRRSTLKNERSLIIGLYKFADKSRLVPLGYSPDLPKLSTVPKNVKHKGESRDAFTLNEWLILISYLNKWEEGVSDDEKYDRRMVKYSILIGVDTGLRPGELRKLRWSMVIVDRPKTADANWPVKINVPQDTKTGARPVQATGGEWFEELRKFSRYRKPNDLVFADRNTGGPFSEKTFYKLWAIAMKETKLDQTGKNLKYYSLRHTYCTFRLMENTNHHILARNMGTSTKYIDEHYDQVEIDLMKDELTKETALQRATPKTNYGLDVGAVLEAYLKKHKVQMLRTADFSKPLNVVDMPEE